MWAWLVDKAIYEARQGHVSGETMETETVVEVHSNEPQPNSAAANDFSEGEIQAENAGETATAVIQPLTTPPGEI